MNTESLRARQQEARSRMVARHLKARGISDPRILEMFLVTPRHEFINEGSREEAYADHPIPIGHGQTVSQPFIVALMAEWASIRPSDRVLEIGTGCGYQTAILAGLCAEVFTVEIIPELLNRAKGTLARLGIRNVRFRSGDGREGWREFAPFDVIIVSAAGASVPPEFESQLADGGRLVMPVATEGDMQRLMRLTRLGKTITSERGTSVRFVPLV